MNEAPLTACWPPPRLTLLAVAAHAAPVDDAVVELQREWEVIRYQTPAGEREKRFEALRPRRTRSARPSRTAAEPLIWEGIVVSSLAGERAASARWAWPSRPGRCTSRRSRSTATRSTARPTTAWASSTTRCPAGRSASATRPRPSELLQKALASIRRASIRTSSTASTWSRPSNADEAIAYLERALQAPARPGPADRRHRPARRGPRAAGQGSRLSAEACSAHARRSDAANAVGRASRRNAARGRAARRCAARSRRRGRCRLRPARPAGGSVRPGAPASRRQRRARVLDAQVVGAEAQRHASLPAGA